MATVHALLSRSDGASVALRELVQTLTPPGCRGAVEITGPDVRLDSDAGQKLGLVLNELMTNSWKYGALGAEKGVVRIGWRCEERHAGETQILLVWQETGGPTIEREPDVGAGLGLISGLAQSDLRGSVDLRFPPQGAQHTIRVRLTPPRGGDLDADRHAGDS
jgi:two-component sensor histidine kinase